MIINLDELNYKNKIEFSYSVLKDDDLDRRIHELKNALVEGVITSNDNGGIELNCEFRGTMMIEDAITLELVPYDFSLNILENYDEIVENYQECIDFSKNTLDLKKILWQNIVLEVPISFTIRADAKLKGNGWELISGEKKSTEIDPRLEKLEDLLKGDD